jgi:TetR/AcrR family transcriptional repressor of mexJK operon
MQNRRQQIIENASHLFAEKGYEGTTMRVIATACGITEAAIYRHFRNKEDLYGEVIRSKVKSHDLDKLRSRRLGEGTIEEVLTGIAHHILSLVDDDPELIRLMFNNSMETGELAAILFKEVRLPYIEYMVSELEYRIEQGEVRSVEPFITSRCFVGMVMDCALNVSVWARINRQDFIAQDVVCNNIPIFARGLVNDGAA